MWAPEGHHHVLHTCCVHESPLSWCLFYVFRRKEIMNRQGRSYFCKILFSFLNYPSQVSLSVLHEEWKYFPTRPYRNLAPSVRSSQANISPFPRVLSDWLQEVLTYKEASNGRKTLNFRVRKVFGFWVGMLGLDVGSTICHLCGTRQVIWTPITLVSISKGLL